MLSLRSFIRDIYALSYCTADELENYPVCSLVSMVDADAVHTKLVKYKVVHGGETYQIEMPKSKTFMFMVGYRG